MLVSIAALGLVAGCARHQHADTKATLPATGETAALSETQVLAIARQAVATNDTWLDQAEFQKPQRQDDGSWSVLVWRLPKTPGGHRVVGINEQGQVTSYFRGR